MSDEFTPTIEEFVYSFLPGNWFNPTAENLFYWDLKGAAAIGFIYGRAAMHMGLSGLSFVEAGYIATDTYTLGKHSTRVVRAIQMLTHPAFIPLAIGTAAVAAQVHTLSSPPPPEYRGSGESGWWRSVAQALTGGFGVGTGVKL